MSSNSSSYHNNRSDNKLKNVLTFFRKTKQHFLYRAVTEFPGYVPEEYPFGRSEDLLAVSLWRLHCIMDERYFMSVPRVFHLTLFT